MTKSLEEIIERRRAAAYEGDVEAAGSYLVALPNARRGQAVLDAYRAGVPVPSFRAMLKVAWDHDHDRLLSAVGHNPAMLKRLFQAAQFDVSCLPRQVTLWRGGVCFFRDCEYWEAPWTLLRGVAWSTRREIACFFATTFRDTKTRLEHLPDAYPCVIRVTVPRQSVLAYFTNRSEYEAIAFTRRFRSHRIDGMDLDPRNTGGDWRPTPQLVADWRTDAETWHRLTQTPIAPTFG
jgi:hypothetical protein